MKYILILFLFIVLTSPIIAQYGTNELSGANAGFETFTGTEDDGTTDDFANWAEVTDTCDATTTKHGGTYAVNLRSAAGTQAQIRTSVSTQSTGAFTYRVSGWSRGDGTNAGEIQLRDVTNASYIFTWVSTGITGTSYQYYEKQGTAGAGCSSLLYYLRSDAGTKQSWFDDVEIRRQLDTLWVQTTGSDTDDDTVKTLSEAFETRGSHSGGVFVIGAGTYDESITVDSSFTKMVTTGEVTVTQIDFNNVTCTVDGCFSITTALNDGNVTYTNQCASEETKTTFDHLDTFDNFLK